MSAIEKGVEIFRIIATTGIAGLWQMLMDKLGDIKEMILEQVKDFVVTKIITAGITWLIGLLNPAAAFIKACKLIYDVVMFFVDNASRILKFVNTVIDSVADIVKGNVSGVVDKINDVLGQMVPIIIGFLASVIGIGGIGQKIRQIIQTLQKPINKALDFVIKTGLKLAGPIIRGIKGISGKVKAKVAAGKAWVKGKVDAGRQWATNKTTAAKERLTSTGARRTNDAKQKGAEQAKGAAPAKDRAAIADADRMLAAGPRHDLATKRLSSLSKQHGVPLRLVTETTDAKGEHVHVQTMTTASHVLPGIDPAEQQRMDDLKSEFVTLVTGLGGDGGKAGAVATFKAGHSSPTDFIREMENRAIKVVKAARQAPEVVKADLQRAGLDFALRRQGTAGAPGEFANVFEYYMTLWVDKRAAAQKRMQADFAAGRRAQPTKRELKEVCAQLALAELTGSPSGAESALRRDRASVEGLNRGGVNADPALSEDQLVAHIRAQAGQLKFGSTTAAAYHSRAHRNEIPESRRESRAFVANYHAAATTVVKDGDAKFFPMPGDTRQVRFIKVTTDDAGLPVTLTVMVYARADGRVVMATFGSFLKND